MRICIILIVAFWGLWVQASPAVLTYQGRIIRSDSTALEYNNVAFIFQITNPTGSCVIYQEQVTGYNMIGSKGVFDVPIGSGTVSWPTSGSFSVLDAFNNSANFSCGLCSGYTCTAASGSYGPLSDDGRVLKVQFHDGNGWKTISPNTIIRSVPFAGYSLSAQKLGSHEADSFVLKSEINSNTSCSGGQFLTWNATTKTFGCAGVSGASGGTVTEVTAASPLSVAAGTESSTPHLTIQAASATQGGYLSSGDWTAFNAKLGPATVFAGDVSGTASNISVNKIKNVSVVTSGLSSGDILKYSGGNWVNDTLAIADISGLSGVMAGKPDYSQFPTTCTAAQTLTFISPVGGFTCTNIAIAGSQVSGNISGTAAGFTGSLSGDVTGTQSATLVGKLQGVAVSATAPTNNQVLKYNGSQWAPASLSSGDLPSGTLSGSGTAGYVPYYSGANTLANSLIYQATGNVGIGTASPNTSAALDVSSTSKGVLMPRMTTAQRNAIASPASGLHIYNTDTKRLEFFDGSNWSYSTANHIVRADSNVTQTGSGVRDFNTKSSDPYNEFDLSSNRFQPLAAGKYLVIARVSGDAMTDGGHLIAQVIKNGVVLDTNYNRASVYASTRAELVTVVELNGSTDYLEIGYTVSSGNVYATQFIAYPLTAAGASSAGADNLGNHTLAQNLVTGSNWISSDGDNEGINIATNGNVGIGKSSATEKLDVSGKVKADEFCLGSTCINTWPSGGGGMIDTAQITDGAVTQDKLATIVGLTAGTYGSSTSIPSITVDTKGRITAVTTNTVAALPAASGASGKFLKSNGTSWSGQDILFSDIKNSSGASAFNIGACGANQTVAWSSLTDSFTCQAIGNLAAEKITSGTLDAARLPSSVTNALWTESSGNVYRNSGSVGVGTTSPATSAVLDVSSTSKGFLPPRMTETQKTAIASPTAGLVIYNTTNNTLQVYNGSSWNDIGNGGGGANVLDSGRLSGSATLTKTFNFAQDYVVIFSGSAAGSNFPLVTLAGDGTSCGQDRSYVSSGNQSSSASCSLSFTAGSHTITSTYAETSGTSNMNWHIMTYVVFGKSAGGATSGQWAANGSDISYSGGNVGIGTASPTSKLVVADGDIMMLTSGRGIGRNPNNATAPRDITWDSSGTLVRDTGYVDFITDSNGDASGGFGFYTGGVSKASATPLMTILMDGRVGIGTTSPSYKLHVVGTAGLSTGTAWTNASDLRLKDIHGDYHRGLDEILQLHTVLYNYKKDNALGLPSDFVKTGFIAQEVQKVIPEAVNKREDGYLELNVDPIHWAVVNAIKEFYQRWFNDSEKLHRELASVKAENAAKDKKIERLESRLDAIEKLLKEKSRDDK